MAPWEFAVAVVALVVLLAELVLGLYVLQRGLSQPSARYLGAFLLVHAVVFGSSSIITALDLWDQDVSHFHYSYLWSGIALLLPALLVAFSLTYPAPPAFLHQRVGATAMLFLPVGVLMAAAWFVRGPYGSPVLDFGLVGTFAAGTLASALIFRRRSRAATTQLEARRLRYMFRTVSVPLLVGSLVLLVFFAVYPYVDFDRVWGGDILLGLMLATFFLFLFGPPAALAYGVLKYRVLQAESRVRLTLRGTMVGSVLLALFLVAFKLAEVWLENTLGQTVIGAVGLGLGLLLLHPLQRASERLVQRWMPVEANREKYREYRKWELYRSAYEDVSTDRIVTTTERRILDRLAESLQLGSGVLATIEAEVERERTERLGGAAPGKPKSPSGPLAEAG